MSLEYRKYHFMTTTHRIILLGIILLSVAVEAQASDRFTTALVLGITPDSTAVAGMHGSARALLARVRDDQNFAPRLKTKRQAMQQLNDKITTLGTSLHTTRDPEVRRAYNEAVRGYAALKAEYDTLCNDFLTDVLTGLPQDQVEQFLICRENRNRRVPSEYRVVRRDDKQWRELRMALRAEKRATRRGEPLDDYLAEVLATARADFKVIEAKIRLDTHRPEVEAVFAQFTNR